MHLQLEAGEAGAEAEVPPAAAEGLVVRLRAVDVEASAGRRRRPRRATPTRTTCIDLLALLDRLAADLGVLGRGAHEPLHDGRVAQDLLDGARDQRRGRRAAPAAARGARAAPACPRGGVAGRVVAGEDQQAKNTRISVVGQLLAVDLGLAQAHDERSSTPSAACALDLRVQVAGHLARTSRWRRPGSGERCASSICSVHSQNFGMSSSGTPISSARTPSGIGTAMSSTKSHSPGLDDLVDDARHARADLVLELGDGARRERLLQDQPVLRVLAAGPCRAAGCG